MRRVSTHIHQIAGNVIAVEAHGVSYGELAVTGTGENKSLAQVIRIEGKRIFLQVFGGAAGISTGDTVRFLERRMQAAFSGNLTGRVFNSTGRPRDRGPGLLEGMVEIGGPPVNPALRAKPSRMIHTGIPMIDVFNSLVESQKISIFTVPGEPYNELTARIALQAEADLIILGGMGLRHDDYLYFRNRLEEGGAFHRSILFIHLASDPVAECLLVPDMALTVAEQFALQGRRVLVLLTDMTNFCDALKEISIIMEKVPSNRGYPGDLYSQLAARYEKAVAFEQGGSITILSVTTMPGNDVTHPVPDNTGYISEGQYYLYNRRIEPFGSLSRLKQAVNKRTRGDHRQLMDAMIRLYAGHQETLEKRAMGFRMSDWDNKLLRYGNLFERQLMDLSINLPLTRALDLGWQILAECFAPEETGLPGDLIQQFWPSADDQPASNSRRT